ncbi:MAG: hypothetical protein QM500_18880 [Methylococcales bacterium]
MKLFYLCLLLGLAILYFIDAALKIDNLSREMLFHNLIRFFSGFVILGIWNLYRHKLKIKVALYLIFAFMISDGVFDYVRNIDNLTFDMLIHDSYVIIWGAISGFFFEKLLHKADS